ncbi:SET domain-containing protein 5 [Pseudocercospora fuligena]|uniref:SET domain-containing protein 5 n=1 Tax=Pseudocercospora fuligena TaxID=685502 RepID=A0A8H6RG41_9PEZI|nr:SET domain-containing protein 5 [Pseudocercospora fuligena]
MSTNMATSTGIRKIDSKGYGVFALKPIGRGTSHVMASKLKKIFHANCFGDEESSYIYLKTSRFNHACIPNVVVATEHAVIALRDIPIGQELEITYLSDRSSGWTARQRKALLPLHYGFECRCIACRPSKFMWLSDCRRRLIGHLKYALDGSLPKYGQLEKLALERVPGHPARRMPLLTAVQRIEYSFLLACLYEAEGHSPPQEVADLYTRAANALGDLQFCYHNVKPVKDLIFLESFRCIRACCVWEGL